MNSSSGLGLGSLNTENSLASSWSMYAACVDSIHVLVAACVDSVHVLVGKTIMPIAMNK